MSDNKRVNNETEETIPRITFFSHATNTLWPPGRTQNTGVTMFSLQLRYSLGLLKNPEQDPIIAAADSLLTTFIPN